MQAHFFVIHGRGQVNAEWWTIVGERYGGVKETSFWMQIAFTSEASGSCLAKNPLQLAT
jgi:hypothetical protein